MHLIIDGYGGDPRTLADLELVRALLDRVPLEIGMVKIAPPCVCRYEGSKPSDWGISGFVLIAESHLSVHTFPERGLLWADIFSCKSFDADRLMEAVREAFSLREARVTLLGRGLEYSEELSPAAARKVSP
jgi:S-adenosylmethionine decarboxylase